MAETIEGLRERRAWLLKQVEATDRAIDKLQNAALDSAFKKLAGRPPRPTPQELPGVPPAPPPPPRKPSVHEENFAEYQKTREGRLARLGVPPVPDRQYTLAFINVTMKRIRDACHDDDELFAIFTAFVAETYPAKMDPPYPFECLASQKVWPKLLQQVRADAALRPH